jgi:hypothetical protein
MKVAVICGMTATFFDVKLLRPQPLGPQACQQVVASIQETRKDKSGTQPAAILFPDKPDDWYPSRPASTGTNFDLGQIAQRQADRLLVVMMLEEQGTILDPVISLAAGKESRLGVAPPPFMLDSGSQIQTAFFLGRVHRGPPYLSLS